MKNNIAISIFLCTSGPKRPFFSQNRRGFAYFTVLFFAALSAFLVISFWSFMTNRHRETENILLRNQGRWLAEGAIELAHSNFHEKANGSGPLFDYLRGEKSKSSRAFGPDSKEKEILELMCSGSEGNWSLDYALIIDEIRDFLPEIAWPHPLEKAFTINILGMAKSQSFSCTIKRTFVGRIYNLSPPPLGLFALWANFIDDQLGSSPHFHGSFTVNNAPFQPGFIFLGDSSFNASYGMEDKLIANIFPEGEKNLVNDDGQDNNWQNNGSQGTGPIQDSIGNSSDDPISDWQIVGVAQGFHRDIVKDPLFSEMKLKEKDLNGWLHPFGLPPNIKVGPIFKSVSINYLVAKAAYNPVRNMLIPLPWKEKAIFTENSDNSQDQTKLPQWIIENYENYCSNIKKYHFQGEDSIIFRNKSINADAIDLAQPMLKRIIRHVDSSSDFVQEYCPFDGHNHSLDLKGHIVKVNGALILPPIAKVVSHGAIICDGPAKLEYINSHDFFLSIINLRGDITINGNICAALLAPDGGLIINKNSAITGLLAAKRLIKPNYQVQLIYSPLYGQDSPSSFQATLSPIIFQNSISFKGGL